jgi:hypothetical protein
MREFICELSIKKKELKRQIRAEKEEERRKARLGIRIRKKNIQTSNSGKKTIHWFFAV